MSGERHEPWRERFDDLKDAYVLDALTEDERQEVEDYLTTHPELQAEVNELKSVANLLALSPQEYEPSPELRRELMNRISSSPNATPAAADPFPQQARLWRIFGPGGIVAAAVLALVTIGMFAWNASLQEENQNLQGELLRQQTYAMEGPGAAQGVQAEVVRLGDERAVLEAQDCPSPPESETYQAWILREDVAEPAGLFEPNDAGVAAAPLEGSIEGADAVAVTLEPSGGSSIPTSDPMLTADL